MKHPFEAILSHSPEASCLTTASHPQPPRRAILKNAICLGTAIITGVNLTGGHLSSAQAQVATTMAIGEEGGKAQNQPKKSTRALGEEGGNGRPTTRRSGEEGAGQKNRINHELNKFKTVLRAKRFGPAYMQYEKLTQMAADQKNQSLKNRLANEAKRLQAALRNDLVAANALADKNLQEALGKILVIESCVTLKEVSKKAAAMHVNMKKKAGYLPAFKEADAARLYEIAIHTTPFADRPRKVQALAKKYPKTAAGKKAAKELSAPMPNITTMALGEEG